jgi:hypothetical protein
MFSLFKPSADKRIQELVEIYKNNKRDGASEETALLHVAGEYKTYNGKLLKDSGPYNNANYAKQVFETTFDNKVNEYSIEKLIHNMISREFAPAYDLPLSIEAIRDPNNPSRKLEQKIKAVLV